MEWLLYLYMFYILNQEILVILVLTFILTNLLNHKQMINYSVVYVFIHIFTMLLQVLMIILSLNRENEVNFNYRNYLMILTGIASIELCIFTSKVVIEYYKIKIYI